MGLSNIALFLLFQNYNIMGATATNFVPGPATLLQVVKASGLSQASGSYELMNMP